MSNWTGYAADLDVALFEDVEEADLDEIVEVGELVHREDAAVHAGDEAKVQSIFGRHACAASELGGVDLADDVGELGARCEALGVALFTRCHHAMGARSPWRARKALPAAVMGLVGSSWTGGVESAPVSGRISR
jgi:hypothetical protein